MPGVADNNQFLVKVTYKLRFLKNNTKNRSLKASTNETLGDSLSVVREEPTTVISELFNVISIYILYLPDNPLRKNLARLQ